MMGTIANPAFQYIQTTGVVNIVADLQAGSLQPVQTLDVLRAMREALDTYQEVVPQDTCIRHLRHQISLFNDRDDTVVDSEELDWVFDRILAHREDIDLAVCLAIRIEALAQFAMAGAAEAANLEAPFDLGTEWCWIPPGAFLMGSGDSDRYAEESEKPLTRTMTGGFFMLNHPVTNAEYRTFLRAKGYEHVILPEGFDHDDQPMPYFNPDEATAYSQWLGQVVSKRTRHPVIGRLPTEGEWEKAAKGPHGDEFILPAKRDGAHFNDEATRRVNHRAVRVNGFGLKDMIGNVLELTSGKYDHQKFTLRGGSWYDNLPQFLRAAQRRGPNPYDKLLPVVGLRPVLVPQP